MPASKPPPAGRFLWLESLALAAFAFSQGRGWLLPLAGTVALFASLLSRGPWFGTAVAAGTSLWWLTIGRLGALSGGALAPAFAVSAILGGIGFAFLGILYRLAAVGADFRLRANLLRLVVIGHFAVAGIFLADQRIPGTGAPVVAWSAAICGLLLAADTARVLLKPLLIPPVEGGVDPAPGAFFFFRWLGPEWRVCLPSDAVSTDHGPGLREMWMWPSIRRAAPALAGVVALVVWAGTCFHEVGASQAGVRSRFGAMEREALPPGIHLSLPWPFGEVRTVDTAGLHQVVLGFRADSGNPILWERPHYLDEELSLVGGGDDFLSISVPILYRVRNPREYLLSTAGADELLRSLAKRSLLGLTLHRPAAEIMTTDREALRVLLHRDLQAELDRHGSGLEVCEVYFRDIHPPVAVAPAFQEVVGAMEEKEALVHGGEEYRLDRLPAAKGDARRSVLEAEAAAVARRLMAEGEAGRFAKRSQARAAAPALYDFREGFNRFDAALAGAKKTIYDASLSKAIPTHLDLRRILNPKLIENSEPSSQPLIPDPLKAPETFNPNVEGYH